MSGITSAQVFATADQLTSLGEKVSINMVRNKLGTGSSGTIQKHLKTWREKEPQPNAITVAISPTLTNALISEMVSFAASSHAEVTKKLIQAEADVEELTQGGEIVEAERDDLRQRLVELTTERDRIAGKSTQQEIDLASLLHRLEHEQSELSNMHVLLAMEKLKSEDFQKRGSDRGREFHRQSELIQIETNTRIASEQLAAVLKTKLDHALALTTKADSANELLSQQLIDATSELHLVRSEMRKLQSEFSAMVQKLQLSQLANQDAISAAKQADRTSAELRGRLDALQERTQDGLKKVRAGNSADSNNGIGIPLAVT
jgi:chromosome segregation ATPase